MPLNKKTDMPLNKEKFKDSFRNSMKVSWSMKSRTDGESTTSEVLMSDHSAIGDANKPLPPPIARCGTLVSPYDAAVARNWDAKLFTNKVFNIWYKRYAGIVPEEMQFQPYDEIQKREDDIALQYYMGPSYRLLENPEDQWSIRQRDAFIRRYSKVRQAEEDKRVMKVSPEPDEAMRVLSLRSILATKKAKDLAMKDMFGPSLQEKMKTESVCKVFMHLRNKRKRKSIAAKRLKASSKWHKLKSAGMLKRLKSIYRSRIASQARIRFVRIIHTVLHIRNFITAISKLAGDTHSIFSGLKHLKEEREKLLDRGNQADSSRLMNFNPAHYTFNKEVNLSQEIKLTLTIPCQQRSSEDVDKIVEVLQQIRAFVAYPIAYQRVLARSAWYIVVPAFRVVIRERHAAVCCYFMINGRATMQRLVGSPHHLQPSDFENIRTLRAQDTFGEEAITNPGCLRNYSVTTESMCELLSVNCHEFQDTMLLSSKYETAPEHIRFLGSLNAMKKFPKLKLLEEAPDNINIAHFVSGSVVTTNVEKSAFVYIVFYGTCDMLRELPPPQSVVDQYVKRKQLSRNETPIFGDASPLRRKSVYVRETMKELKEERDQDTLAADNSRGSYFASRRDYIEGRENLRNVFMKEIEKRQNEYMSYRNAFMAETRELENKCRQISLTMPIAAQRRLMGEHITARRITPSDNKQAARSLNPERNLDHFGAPRRLSRSGARVVSHDGVDDKDDSSRRQSTFNSKAGSKLESMEGLAGKEDKDESSRRQTAFDSKAGSKTGSKAGSKTGSKTGSKPGSRQGDKDDSRRHTAFAPATPQKTPPKPGSKELLAGKEDKDEKMRASRKYTKIVGSNMNLLDAVFRTSIHSVQPEVERSRKPSIVTPTTEEEDSQILLAKSQERSQTSSFSRWALVKTAIRGDVMGTEYLDFRSEPFEPPKEVRSIITAGGATIIMVKKSFLLKYLRKEW